jgi:hypothetical protein
MDRMVSFDWAADGLAGGKREWWRMSWGLQGDPWDI